MKIVQWRRRTIENYLLDIDVLTDLLTDSDVVRAPLQNMGQVGDILRRLADNQLSDTAAQDVYESRAYTSPGLRKMEIQGKSISEAANVLFTRLASIKSETGSLDESSWKECFVADVEQKRNELKSEWDTSWTTMCDGKRLFKDLQLEVPLKMSTQKFKRQVMLRMRLQQSDAWLSMDGLIANAIEQVDVS